MKIGVDNTDGKGFSVNLDVEGSWVSCDEYDWLYELTDDQLDTMQSGDLAAQREVFEVITYGPANWFDHD